MGIFDRIRQTKADFRIAKQRLPRERKNFYTGEGAIEEAKRLRAEQKIQRQEQRARDYIIQQENRGREEIIAKREQLTQRFFTTAGTTLDKYGSKVLGKRPKAAPLDLRGRAGVGPRYENTTFQIRGREDLRPDENDIGDPAWLR